MDWNASTGGTFKWNSPISKYTDTFQRKGDVLTIQLHLSSTSESKLVYKINNIKIFSLYDIARGHGLNYQLAISMYTKGVSLQLVD